MRILIKAPFGYFCFGTIEWSLWYLYYNNILPSDGDFFWSESWDSLHLQFSS
jgi:hypothetical protein